MQRFRLLLAVVGVLATVVAAVGISAHFMGMVSTTATLIASFTPLLVLCGLAAIPLLLLARQRVLAVVAVLVTVVGVGSQLPLFIGVSEGLDSAGPTVRLLQSNIRLGEADAETLVRTVVDQKVDLLTVIELTPEAAQRLSDAGLDNALPHSFLRPREGGGGAGIFSRFPLHGGTQLEGFELGNLKTVVTIPGTAPTVLYALHPLPPYPEPSWKWAYELRRLRGEFSADHRPMIIGADFNSTYDHRQFRDLLRNSAVDAEGPLLDAVEYLGAGIVATYPADRRYPAVLGIDKVLTRGGTPLSFNRIELPGSDHYGVLADIRLDDVS